MRVKSALKWTKAAEIGIIFKARNTFNNQEKHVSIKYMQINIKMLIKTERGYKLPAEEMFSLYW